MVANKDISRPYHQNGSEAGTGQSRKASAREVAHPEGGLRRILEQLCSLMNCDASMVWLFNEGVLQPYASWNRLGGREPTMTVKVAARDREVFVNAWPQWERVNLLPLESVSGQPPTLPYGLFLSAPLEWDGRTRGALTALNREDARCSGESDRRMLVLFANMVSITIANAELRSELAQVTGRLDRVVNEKALVEERAHAELQQLLAKTVRLQEKERSRVALDLHDGSNQYLTAALLEIQAACECIQQGQNTGALEKQETAKSLLRQVEAEHRRIIAGLRPPNLDTVGLVAALRTQADAFAEFYSVRCTVYLTGQPIPMSDEVETQVYRIVQEAMNNVGAHSQAWNVQIRFNFRPNYLQVIIEDDGVGFEVDRLPATGRLGLVGMRERALSLGGRLTVRSNRKRGTTVVLDLPLTPETAAAAMSARRRQAKRPQGPVQASGHWDGRHDGISRSIMFGHRYHGCKHI